MASPLQTQDGPIPVSEQGQSNNSENSPVAIHILEEGRFHEKENDSCHIKGIRSSPFEILSGEHNELGTGARASVVKVLVKSRGLRFRVDSAASQTTCLYDDVDGTLHYAMKMFKEPKGYIREANIQKILRRYPQRSIMTAFCGFRCDSHDVSTPPYNMVFPLATMDLDKYFKTKYHRPRIAAERLSNIAEMISIAEGLEWLAEKIDHRDSYGRISIIHYDLKPANILVCKVQTENDLKLVFRISDFSEAVFNYPDTEPMLGGGKSRAGVGDFAAPEASFDHYTPGPSFDVWSFACILYLVLSFNLDSEWNPATARDHRFDKEGTYRFFMKKPRQKFSTMRSQHKKTIGDQYELHPVVKTGLEELKKKGRNKPDSLITAGLCNLLQNKIFRVDPKERPQIGDVVKDMVQIYRLRTIPQQDMSVRSSDKPKNLCAQSPDGRYQFFLEKKALSIWDSQAPIPHVRTLEMSENFTFGLESCARDSLCYVEKTAQTQNQNRSSTSERSPTRRILILTSKSYERAEPGAPIELEGCEEVTQSAMSPDGRFAAVVARLANSVTVVRVYLEIKDVLSQFERPQTLISNATSPAGADERYKDLGPFRGIIKARGRGLQFSRSGRYLCFVYEIGIGRQSHFDIYVYDAESDDIHWEKLMNQAPIYSHFLNCVTPFNRELSFIAVTTKGRVFLSRKGSPGRSSYIEEWQRPNLVAALITKDDEWVVFIVQDKTLAISVARFNDSPKLQRKLNTTGTNGIHFDPEVDRVRLCEDEGERSLLFTLVESKRSMRLYIELLFQ